MSRLYDGVAQTTRVDSTPITAYPYSIAGWAFNTASISNCMLSIVDKDVSDQYAYVGDSGTRCRTRSRAGTEVTADSSNTHGLNVWVHYCGVYPSATLRSSYLNGNGRVDNTTSITPAGQDRVSIGDVGDSTPAAFFPGRLALCAIWNVALTDQEVLTLANGWSPLRMRRDNLVFLAPDNGNASPEIEIIGQRHLTLVGAPSKAEEPPVPFAMLVP